MNPPRSADELPASEKLPFTKFDLPGEQEDQPKPSWIPKRFERFEKFAVQCLAVVILMNMVLYYVTKRSSASEIRITSCSNENPTSEEYLSQTDGSMTSKPGANDPLSWVLAASGAQTEKPSALFHDLTDICLAYSSTFSPEENSDDCVSSTISSIILYSESLVSLRHEILDYAVPGFSSRGRFPPNSKWEETSSYRSNIPVSFPRLISNSITEFVGTPIHHVGYHCPYTQSCNNPIFSISAHSGIPLSFTYLPSITGSQAHRISFGFGNTSEELTTSSGFDFLLNLSENLMLDPEEDYPQMKNDLTCLLGRGLKMSGIFFDIRNNAREEGLRGAISPWVSGGDSEIERMSGVIVPKKDMTTCAGAMAQHASFMRSIWWWIWGCFLVVITVVIVLRDRWIGRESIIRL